MDEVSTSGILVAVANVARIFTFFSRRFASMEWTHPQVPIWWSIRTTAVSSMLKDVVKCFGSMAIRSWLCQLWKTKRFCFYLKRERDTFEWDFGVLWFVITLLFQLLSRVAAESGAESSAGNGMSQATINKVSLLGPVARKLASCSITTFQNLNWHSLHPFKAYSSVQWLHFSIVFAILSRHIFISRPIVLP